MPAVENDQLPETSLQIALSDRSMIGTLVGTSIAILTFLLFFLYPRSLSGEVNPALFQTTITVILAAIFSFGASALYRHITITTPVKSGPKAQLRFRRAELFFSLAFALMLLEPTFVLFTLRLVPVAFIALGLWISYLCLYVYQFKHRNDGGPGTLRIRV